MTVPVSRTVAERAFAAFFLAAAWLPGTASATGVADPARSGGLAQQGAVPAPAPVPTGKARAAGDGSPQRDLIEETLHDAGQEAGGGALEEVTKKHLGDKGSKAFGLGAPLVIELVPALESYYSGDAGQAFAEASGSLAGAGAGFVTQLSLTSMAVPFSPASAVLAGFAAGFAAKQIVRGLVEDYNDYRNILQARAVLDGEFWQVAHRQQLQQIQAAMQQAQAQRNPDLVARLGDYQKSVIASHRQRRQAADQMAKAMDRMAQLIRGAEAGAKALEPLEKAAGQRADESYRALLRAESELETARNALTGARGPQRTPAEEHVRRLEERVKVLAGQHDRDAHVARDIAYFRRDLLERARDWRERFSAELKRFKQAVEAMKGSEAADELARLMAAAVAGPAKADEALTSGVRLALSAPAGWQGGVGDKGFHFQRDPERGGPTDPSECPNPAEISGELSGTLDGSSSPRTPEEIEDRAQQEVKNQARWGLTGVIRPFSIGRFTGRMMEAAVIYTPGSWGGGFVNSWTTAVARGWLVHEGRTLEVQYAVRSSGCFNNSQQPFQEARTRAAQAEAQAALASLRVLDPAGAVAAPSAPIAPGPLERADSKVMQWVAPPAGSGTLWMPSSP